MAQEISSVELVVFPLDILQVKYSLTYINNYEKAYRHQGTENSVLTEHLWYALHPPFLFDFGGSLVRMLGTTWLIP